jgi:type II secretory pathway pseudopilin PulG
MKTHIISDRPCSAASEAGFSLIETIIAMGILATGLLSLAAVFASGLSNLASSSANLVAREKAREAIESVHTARDTRIIQWAQIRNVSQGGVFQDGPQPLRTAGADGLVNTADDTGMETSLGPGPDNRLGTADDVRTPMTTYTREIRISDIITNGVANPNLRQLQVLVTYTVGRNRRTYTLTTFVSSIS